jgi:PadR family transcriptional regulator PadR
MRGEALNAQLKKGNLDLCVLALLCRSDMYGYELVNRISRAVEISEGTIYPLLKRIKDDGYVTTYLTESQGGAPRKYYSITPEGAKRKEELAQEWEAFVKGINALLGGLENV